MKENITKFDLDAAFRALDEIDVPKVKGIRANRMDLSESCKRVDRLSMLVEDYYDVQDQGDLETAQDEREKDIAAAKMERIERIVDLDAESPEDLLPSYEGKVIIQCPQCMMTFFKNPEDIEHDPDDDSTVNVNEICQHCGNDSGYTVVGKVAADDGAGENGGATEETDINLEEVPTEEENTEDVSAEETTEETTEEPTEEEFNLDDISVDTEANESLNRSKFQKECEKESDLKTEIESEHKSLNEGIVEEDAEMSEAWNDGIIAELEQSDLIGGLDYKDYSKIINVYAKLKARDEEPVELGRVTAQEILDYIGDIGIGQFIMDGSELDAGKLSFEAIEKLAPKDEKFMKAVREYVDNYGLLDAITFDDDDEIAGESKSDHDYLWAAYDTHYTPEELHDSNEQIEKNMRKYIGEGCENCNEAMSAKAALAQFKAGLSEGKCVNCDEDAKSDLARFKAGLKENAADELKHFADSLTECGDKQTVEEDLQSEQAIEDLVDTFDEDAEISCDGCEELKEEDDFDEKEFNAMISDPKYYEELHEDADRILADNGFSLAEVDKILDDKIDEIDENNANESLSEALREVYENVNNFTTTSCKVDGNKLVVEGVINFKSGNKKNTSFTFVNEGKELNCYNKDLAEGCIYKTLYNTNNKTFFIEGLSYKYNIGKSLVEGYIINEQSRRLTEDFADDVKALYANGKQPTADDILAVYNKVNNRAKNKDEKVPSGKDKVSDELRVAAEKVGKNVIDVDRVKCIAYNPQDTPVGITVNGTKKPVRYLNLHTAQIYGERVSKLGNISEVVLTVTANTDAYGSDDEWDIIVYSHGKIVEDNRKELTKELLADAAKNDSDIVDLDDNEAENVAKITAEVKDACDKNTQYINKAYVDSLDNDTAKVVYDYINLWININNNALSEKSFTDKFKHVASQPNNGLDAAKNSKNYELKGYASDDVIIGLFNKKNQHTRQHGNNNQ